MKFLNQLVSQHLARYPGLELADLYKLLHQAALGPGHAVADSAESRSRLLEELAALGEGPSEPLKDVISPDGRLARLHLRAFRDSGGDPERLHRAFVETAKSYPASREKLEKFCGCLGDLADAGAIPFSRSEVDDYLGRIAQNGYPAVHHSPAFRSAWKPAYRVVAIDLLTP